VRQDRTITLMKNNGARERKRLKLEREPPKRKGESIRAGVTGLRPCNPWEMGRKEVKKGVEKEKERAQGGKGLS